MNGVHIGSRAIAFGIWSLRLRILVSELRDTVSRVQDSGCRVYGVWDSSLGFGFRGLESRCRV